MKKLILSLVLIFFISLSSLKIYSYSKDMNTQYITNENTHIVISQNLETEEGKQLVPKGAILGVDDTEEMIFTYKIFVQEGMEIDYNITNIEINNEIVSSEISDLFEFEFEVDSIELDSLQLELFEGEQAGYFIEITVILSMNFPTEEQYLLVAGQELNFEISFRSSELIAVNTM